MADVTIVIDNEDRLLPVGQSDEIESNAWLPASGALRVGLTSGASTPDNLVERVVRTLDGFANPD